MSPRCCRSSASHPFPPRTAPSEDKPLFPSRSCRDLEFGNRVLISYRTVLLSNDIDRNYVRFTYLEISIPVPLLPEFRALPSTSSYTARFISAARKKKYQYVLDSHPLQMDLSNFRSARTAASEPGTLRSLARGLRGLELSSLQHPFPAHPFQRAVIAIFRMTFAADAAHSFVKGAFVHALGAGGPPGD